MSHVTLARVVQAQVVPAATATEPAVADAPTEAATLESAGAHGAEDAKRHQGTVDVNGRCARRFLRRAADLLTRHVLPR